VGFRSLRVIEASFVAIERTVEFRLLERGTMQTDDLPGTYPGVYQEAAAAGVFGESIGWARLSSAC
jgi:hypothetical protein